MCEDVQSTLSGDKPSLKGGFTHDDYTVGWICPLEVELIAALEMLDEEHEGLPQPSSDHTVYTLGSIAGKNVVIAGLWKPGNNAAATVVTQMRNTFPNVRFGLLVGIGGGVPAMTEQGRIHLGDVVVSKPTGIHSGVVQYDHGKAYNGRFERTGALAPPPAVLLQAAQVLAAKRARWRRDPLVDNIMRIDTSVPSLSRFRYPGADRDDLYPPEYVHRAPGVSCRQCGCDSEQRIVDDLVEEADKDAPPSIVVHRGTVASGELVIKDGVVRDRLAQEHGILCFEMETAGALADFPCLAIRGVSDYCDSHKNDDWHGYAAAAAAAYARELLFHLPIDQVIRLAHVPKIERNLEKLVNLVDDDERQDILEFISPSSLDQGPRQADVLSQKHEDSGRYILETEAFRSWIDGNQTLFCPGIPGAGKTIMTSIVVDYLQQQFLDTPAVGIAYFFCNFSQDYTLTATSLIACLLRQLVQNMPQIPGAIRDLFARHKKHNTRPQLHDICKFVNLVASESSRVYIMIDALDECKEEIRDCVLSTIFDLQSKCRLSLFATSRFVPDITSQFEQYPWLEIRAHPNDVRSYLSGQIANLRPFVRKDANLRELIIESIAKAIDGMFLLARLYIDSLRKTPSVKSIKSALKSLPTGSSAYNQTYHAAMERINSQDSDSHTLAKRALSWLVCSKEHLTLTQLQHALGVEIGSSAFDEENLPDIECLISTCAGLVAFDEHSHIIRLVHYTTQEYFEQTWNEWFPNAHAEIAERYITYLNFDVFETGPCQQEDDYYRRLKENPLYERATLSWDFHARLQPVHENLLYDFLKDSQKVSACFQARMTSGFNYVPDFVSKRNTGLHLAAYIGFIEVVENLLIDTDPDVLNDWNETPLALAVDRGHKDVVKLLRDHRASIETKDRFSQTPLFVAVAVGDVGMVKMLLAEGADPSVGDEKGTTPFFQAAAQTDNEEICKLLLHNGCELQVESPAYDKNCLQIAAKRGMTGIVEVMLDAGVDPTYYRGGQSSQHNDKIRHAPLCLAAKNGHEATVKVLLDRTADHNVATQTNQMALGMSARNGHGTIVRLLIQRGVNLDSKEFWGMTPLLIAIHYNQVEIVNVLLESGASADLGVQCHELDSLLSNHQKRFELPRQLKRVFQNFRDRAVVMAPLALAVMKGNRTIYRHLLLYASATDEGKKQQLLWACDEGYEMAVDVLLEEDVHPDCCDQTGRTPLSITAERGHEVIAHRLLEKGAMPGSRDIAGQTPLSYALENGHKEIFYLLGRKNPHQLSCRDIFGRSLLLLSSEMDDHQVYKFILEATLTNESIHETLDRDLAIVHRNISCMDAGLLRAFGGNCLLWAVRNDHSHIASQLLWNGVNPNHKDRNNVTALVVAIKKDNEPLARSLLASGANPNLEDKHGRTALSWALFQQSEKLVLFLLEHKVDLSMRITGFWRRWRGSHFDGTYRLLEYWSEHKSPLELAVCSSSKVIAAFLQYTGWSAASYEAALLQAVRARKIVTIRLLLERKLDKDILYEPLREAILDKQNDTVRILLNDGLGQRYVLDEDGIRLMFTATCKGLDDVVKFMLDKGAGCNYRLTDSIEKWRRGQFSFARTTSLKVDNRSLLSIAAREGHEAIVNLLLDYGADPSLKNNCGDYPLLAAIRYRHHNVTEILKEKGQKLSPGETKTLLYEAAMDGDLYTVETLIKDIAEDSWKGVALWWAVCDKRLAVVKMLLQAQADPNHKHNIDWNCMPITPLMIATKKRALACARALLGAGADPNIPDHRDRTPLSLAAEQGRQPLIESLLDYHAAVDLADKHNRTPLFFAAINGHERAVKTLLEYGSAAAHTMTSAQRSAFSVAQDLGFEEIAFLLRDQNQASQHSPHSASDIDCTPLYCDDCCCEIQSPLSPHCSVCSGPSRDYCDICNECMMKHLPRDSLTPSFECEICRWGIPDSDTHFHCPICVWLGREGFVLCLECFRGGYRCYDKLHAYEKRTLKGKQIVVERIIRPWSTDE